MDIPQPIQALAGQTEALTEQVTAWANLNSGSGNAHGLERMLAVLRDAYASLGGAAVESVLLPGLKTSALRVRMRPEAPRQVLCSGHYDTVYDAGHEFQRCTRVDAATLRGPGVADMKGGLVVMLAALRAFEAGRPNDAVGWEVLLTPDEETGSAASAALLAEAAKRHRLALVFEPSPPSGKLVRARKGTGIFTATCHGRAAHAGRNPEEGRNAIVALAEFIPAAERAVKALPGVLLNMGRIEGGGAVNIVPDFARVEMNLRTSAPEDESRALERLREAAAPINAREGYRLEISGRFNRPPKTVSATEEAWFARYRECGRALGTELQWQDVGGGSDGNLLAAAGVACLDGLGPIGDGLHSSKETVHLPSLAARAQIAALFLHRLAAEGGVG